MAHVFLYTMWFNTLLLQGNLLCVCPLIVRIELTVLTWLTDCNLCTLTLTLTLFTNTSSTPNSVSWLPHLCSFIESTLNSKTLMSPPQTRVTNPHNPFFTTSLTVSFQHNLHLKRNLSRCTKSLNILWCFPPAFKQKINNYFLVSCPPATSSYSFFFTC